MSRRAPHRWRAASWSGAPRASTYEFAEPLSPREIDIVAQLASGRSNEALGEAHGISAGTVKWHLGNVFGKLGVRNRTAAVATSRELGYL